MDFTAASIYGGPASTQPDPYAAASGAPSVGGEPGARTVARPRPGITGNPTLMLMVLLGVAALLVNFTVRLEVSG